MTNKKHPTIYITRKLSDVVETRMRELFEVELNIDNAPRSEAELLAAMQQADVLVQTVKDRITGVMIEQAGKQLKLIASFSNGIDHIDVDAAARKGITVTNTPNVLTEDSADMTMALVLAVPRRAKAFGLSIHYQTASASDRPRKRSLRQPIGIASTRCWRASICFG